MGQAKRPLDPTDLFFFFFKKNGFFINIAEPKALVGFTGPRVIEQTLKVQLPEGFQRSEFLLEHGAIDMIVHRKDLRTTVNRLLQNLLNKTSV